VHNDLEQAITQIEAHVAALGATLRARDAAALEAASQTLQRTLAASVQRFAAAARAAGGVPLPLRRRIALINGQLGAHREQLVRGSAALERAMTLLIPAGAAPAYASSGALAPLARGEYLGA
jgi:hypothetical protein